MSEKHFRYLVTLEEGVLKSLSKRLFFESFPAIEEYFKVRPGKLIIEKIECGDCDGTGMTYEDWNIYNSARNSHAEGDILDRYPHLRKYREDSVKVPLNPSKPYEQKTEK